MMQALREPLQTEFSLQLSSLPFHLESLLHPARLQIARPSPLVSSVGRVCKLLPYLGTVLAADRARRGLPWSPLVPATCSPETKTRCGSHSHPQILGIEARS